MARELKPEKSDSLAARMKSDVRAPPLVEREKDTLKNVIPSHTSSRNSSSRATAAIIGEAGVHSAAEQGVQYSPYYSVYSGSYNQYDNQGYFDAGSASSSYKSDDGSHLYYMPGYNNYPAGAYMCVDGNQPYGTLPGFVQNSLYGSDLMTQHYCNTTQSSSVTHGTAAVRGGAKLLLSSDILANTDSSDYQMKGYNALSSKAHSSAQCTNSSQYSSKFYESLLYGGQSSKSLHQLGSSYGSTADAQAFQPYGKWSSFSGSKQGGGYFAQDAPLNYKRADARTWSGNTGSSSKKPIHGELEDTNDPTGGPRRHLKNIPLGSSAEKEQTGISINRYQFNLENFQIEYDDAKFYVIKSYNEDNIHKSVKYNVWSSTPDGNKKLDGAFRDKMAKTSETGRECPIFLFFSVNGSGQFVGVAEMIGPVDFDSNLGIWELNKWNGFFPVKWHIIKDVPNAQLRHIVLENNDNRPVTFTRDTQEIGLDQGLEMLKIFKTFAEETSLLEDFNFYEKREQSLEIKRNTAQTEVHGDSLKLKKELKRIVGEQSGASDNFSDSKSSLINLAKNLSLSN